MIIQVTIMGLVTGYTRSLDYGSNEDVQAWYF